MRVLAFINLAGLLALGVLCVAQWQENRRLNQDVNRLEAVRIELTDELKEREEVVAGQGRDLDDFRDRLLETTESLKRVEGELALERHTNEALVSEREQLRDSVKKWSAAVETRDERIRENQDRLREIGERLNDTVTKYNELATNYNESVELLNERTTAYNELVERYNELARAGR